jgi:hypothetical protein
MNERHFTADDVKYIADLPNHAGWTIFRDMLRATHDNLTNALATAPDQETQNRLYVEWRAYRTLLANTQSMEAYAQQLFNQLEEAQRIAVQQQQGVFETPETQISEAEHANLMQHLQPPTAKQTPTRLVPAT